MGNTQLIVSGPRINLGTYDEVVSRTDANQRIGLRIAGEESVGNDYALLKFGSGNIPFEYDVVCDNKGVYSNKAALNFGQGMLRGAWVRSGRNTEANFGLDTEPLGFIWQPQFNVSNVIGLPMNVIIPKMRLEEPALGQYHRLARESDRAFKIITRALGLL